MHRIVPEGVRADSNLRQFVNRELGVRVRRGHPRRDVTDEQRENDGHCRRDEEGSRAVAHRSFHQNPDGSYAG